MFQFVRQMIHQRNFWSSVSFNELSELYVSIMIRTMSLSLIGIFIPVYLYQIGYSLASISIYFAFLYGLRILLDPVIASLIRTYGPKGVIRFSYLSSIINLGLLLLMKDYPIPYLVVSFFHALALGAFYLSFNFDFSKMKSDSHEGKELGTVYTFQKIGGVMGPLAGGVIASFFGVQYTILLSMILLIIASVPLMLTPETVQTHKYKKFRYRDLYQFKRDFWPSFGFGLNASGAMLIWPLFISIVVFKENVYASLGFVTTVSLFMALISAYFFGTVIDDKKGKALLEWSSIATGISMFIRPFISTLTGVLAINVVTEPLLNGILMPFNKGEFDASDRAGDKRLSYLTSILIYSHIARTLLWLLIGLLAINLNEISALEFAFVASGLGAFLITTQKFKALNP